MMKVLFLAVLTVVVSVGVAPNRRRGTASGRFRYSNMQCKWHEGRVTNTERSLTVQCRGSNGFSTKYQGNPHRCPWYRDGNQQAYYVCLVQALIRVNFDENSPSEITCRGHCEDIVFQKTRTRLLRLMKKTDYTEAMTETAEPDWGEFENINVFN